MSETTKLGIVASRMISNGEPAAPATPNPDIISAAKMARIRAAKLAAARLFDLLPPLDVGDPRAFLAGTVAIFAEYPAEVMQAAIDPVHGIPSRTDRPTLRLIKAVCDEFYTRVERQEERLRASEDAARSREPPRKPRTPEQQAAIDAQVAEARQQLGIPQTGLTARAAQSPPVRRDPERMKGVLADLAARKARNEQR
jgi:hypothetical protein